MKKEEVLQVLPERLRQIVERSVADWNTVQEIHIRLGKGIAITANGRKELPNPNGQVVSRREFRELMEYISNYSLYAFEEEIKKGFLTIPGGHRVGVSGRAVTEDNEVKKLRNISFVNIRIAHEKKGCADAVMPYLLEKDRFLSTLLVSPPGAGKTTLLRDIVRNLASGGNLAGSGRMFGAKNVSVVDERSEIASCYMGVPQNDVGMFCDVLDACPKSEGIRMMLRSMAPEVIAVDEIGTGNEYEALTEALTSGCSLLATVHGDSIRHIREKPFLKQLLEERMFERIIILRQKEHPGVIEGIFDAGGQVIMK